MNDETFQYIVMAVAALCQLYTVQDHDYPLAAWFYDKIATFFGTLANFFGYIAMNARLNYFTVVNSYG
jgi:hypothetical protein